MNVIHSVFSLVLKFRSQLISRPWGPAEHPNFALMQQSYSTFKYYSHFLFKGEPSPQAGPGWGQVGRAAGGSPGCSWHPPARSGDQAGEPRLPAAPGGLPAAHQLQQLLPGRLSVARGAPGPSDHARGEEAVRKRLLYLQVPSRQEASRAARPGLAGAGDSREAPSAELASRAEWGWAAESASDGDGSGPDWTSPPSWRGGVGERWLVDRRRLLDSAGLRALGPPGVEAPRRLRGSGDAELRRPERGPAAVGASPASRAARPLRLGDIRDLGGLPVPVVWSLQQLQHPSHLGDQGGVVGAPRPQPTPCCGTQGQSRDRCALASEKSPFSAASMALCAM